MEKEYTYMKKILLNDGTIKYKEAKCKRIVKGLYDKHTCENYAKEVTDMLKLGLSKTLISKKIGLSYYMITKIKNNIKDPIEESFGATDKNE